MGVFRFGLVHLERKEAFLKVSQIYNRERIEISVLICREVLKLLKTYCTIYFDIICNDAANGQLDFKGQIDIFFKSVLKSQISK